MTKREETLDKAKEIIHGDRDLEYGGPELSFDAIARLWGTYLEMSGVIEDQSEITPRMVCDMMIQFKIARNITGNPKVDNYVDIAGYAGCGSEFISNLKEGKVSICAMCKHCIDDHCDLDGMSTDSYVVGDCAQFDAEGEIDYGKK